MINIKTNVNQFIKTEIKQWNDTVKRATIAAENKAAAQGLTFAKKTIREDYNIKASDLSKVMKKTKADKRGRVASIIATGKAIALAKFRARQTKKGVGVTVKKGKRKLLPGHFVAIMPSGHKGVFIRKEMSGGKKAARLPIKERFGPGAATLLGSRKVQGRVIIFIRQKFPKLYEDAFNHFKSRK